MRSLRYCFTLMLFWIIMIASYAFIPSIVFTAIGMILALMIGVFIVTILTWNDFNHVHGEDIIYGSNRNR